jgi:hypothetical protein
VLVCAELRLAALPPVGLEWVDGPEQIVHHRFLAQEGRMSPGVVLTEVVQTGAILHVILGTTGRLCSVSSSADWLVSLAREGRGQRVAGFQKDARIGHVKTARNSLVFCQLESWHSSRLCVLPRWDARIAVACLAAFTPRCMDLPPGPCCQRTIAADGGRSAGPLDDTLLGLAFGDGALAGRNVRK